MEQVAQASGEIEKLASPELARPRRTASWRCGQNRMSDVLYGRTAEFFLSTVLLLILLYFLLAYDTVFLGKVIKLMPTLQNKRRAVSILHEIESHVSKYLLTITLINIGLGAAVGVTVWLLGLQNPLMWGVMVAVLNFVPYLGAMTGIICMTIGAVLSYDSLGYAMVFPAAYLIIATIEGNFITPYVMGRSLTLNPVIILPLAHLLGLDVGHRRNHPRCADPRRVQDLLRARRGDGADRGVLELTSRRRAGGFW
jgi:predicted PurR-regulated permease PerM